MALARATALAQERARAAAEATAFAQERARAAAEAKAQARLEAWAARIDAAFAAANRPAPGQCARAWCVTVLRIFVAKGIPKNAAAKIATFALP